jgi:hypothetical protein
VEDDVVEDVVEDDVVEDVVDVSVESLPSRT